MLRKIGRIIKRILAVLFILVLLAVIGIVIFVMTFDLNRYKDLAAEKLTLILNRPVKIESMHTKLTLIPTITITGFKVENNAPFQEKAPLLSIQKMDAELELAPLLNSQINIHKVNMDSAEINLFKNKDTNNWTLSQPTSKSTEEKPKNSPQNAKIDLQKNIRLNSATIGTLQLAYDDGTKKQDITLNKLEMKNFHMLTGELVHKNQTFNFNLNAGTIFDVLNQKPNFPIDLKIQSRLANGSINGKIGDFKALTDLQATLNLRTNNLKNLFNFFGIKNPLIPTQNAQVQFQATGSIDNLVIKQANFNINSDKDLTFKSTGTLKSLTQKPTLILDINAQLLENKLTELWRVQPMNLKGDVTITPSGLKSKTITIDANRSDMRLATDISIKNKKCNISAALASNFLNIYDFIKKPDNKKNEGSTPTTETHKSATQLPWEMLQKANVNLNLNIKHIQANDWFTDYIGIKTQSTLYDGVLKFPYEVTALNGKLSGTLNANANTKVMTLNTQGSDLNLNGLRPLAQDIKDVILATKISATTKGNDTKALLNNLNGQIIAETNKGQIINKWFTDLPKLLNLNKNKQNISFSNTDNRILIHCAAANIIIKDGVITGKDQFALETNTLNVSVEGTINLKNQTMDILAQPALSDGTAEDLLSLTKYIRISGPFNKLTPRVDTEKAAGNLIQAGVAKLAGVETTKLQTIKTTGGMCQNVLGKNALISKEKVRIVTTQPQTKAQPTQPTNQKQQFEKELLNSLFQALTPQQ